MIEAYSNTLKKYTDAQVREAGYRCLEDCEYIPKPSDIKKRIQLIPVNEYKASYEIKDGRKCGECGNSPVTVIIENGTQTCRRCYTGMTHKEIQSKFRQIISSIGRKL